MALSRSDKDTFQRLVQIAHQHIMFCRRNPIIAGGIAAENGITLDAMTASAVADHIMEEFRLIRRKGA